MKTLAIVKYVFAVLGISMLLGAFFLYRSTSAFISEAATAQGTVIELVQSRSSDSTTYRPVVKFVSETGQAVEFISSSGSNPPGYSVGEIVEVFYDRANPQQAKINGFFSLWGGAVILGGLGGVFFLIGAIIILVGKLKGRQDEYLRQKGTPLDTEFQSVELNTALSVNGRHPFRVLTQWLNPVTSELHIFASNNIWFDPSNFINAKHITVYVDNGNPKKYYVDLSFLPKLAKS